MANLSRDGTSIALISALIAAYHLFRLVAGP